MDSSGSPRPFRKVVWSERFSHEAHSKPLPSLQTMVSKYASIPGMIGMHGGLPPSDSFPFSAFDCSLPHAPIGSITSTSSNKQDPNPTPAAAAAQPAAGPGQPEANLKEGCHLCVKDPALMASAQQYNFHVKGYPPLQAWARDFIYRYQQPATIKSNPSTTASSSSSSGGSGSSSSCSTQEPIGCEVIITSGNSSALDALTRVLLNPGDPILLEEYTYSHFVEAHLLPIGCELLPIPLDHKGLVPSHLDAIMSSRQAAGLPLPRVLYTIPTGQNPTGSVMTQQRMTEVYDLAQKWDLVIIEDDAYYWLQYLEGPDNVPGLNLRSGFLSLDVAGRVIRIDTLAKLLGPGFRLGWLAGPPEVALKVALYLASSTVGASSLSQVLIHQLLDHWGHQGLESFVCRLQQRYAHFAAVAAAAACEHLQGLVEWRPANAGMFLWMKLLGDNVDTAKLLEYTAAEKIMIVPGQLSSVKHLAAAAAQLRRQRQQQQQQQQQRGIVQPQQQQSDGVSAEEHQVQEKLQALNAEETAAVNHGEACPYFRVSFASVESENSLKEGFARLGRAIRKYLEDLQT